MTPDQYAAAIVAKLRQDLAEAAFEAEPDDVQGYIVETTKDVGNA